MLFTATYKDHLGAVRNKRIDAQDEFEARKVLRRSGIAAHSVTFAVTDAKPQPAPQSQSVSCTNSSNTFKEKTPVRQQDKKPESFYRILTNDISPTEYEDDVQYEYKHLRLDYKGRGITQELHILDIDGIRVTGWFSGGNVPTLPDIFQTLGNAGWKMIGHQINQDLSQNGVTFHYYNFMRLKRANKADRHFSAPRQSKNLISTAVESLGA